MQDKERQKQMIAAEMDGVYEAAYRSQGDLYSQAAIEKITAGLIAHALALQSIIGKEKTAAALVELNGVVSGWSAISKAPETGQLAAAAA